MGFPPFWQTERAWLFRSYRYIPPFRVLFSAVVSIFPVPQSGVPGRAGASRNAAARSGLDAGARSARYLQALSAKSYNPFLTHEIRFLCQCLLSENRLRPWGRCPQYPYKGFQPLTLFPPHFMRRDIKFGVKPFSKGLQGLGQSPKVFTVLI